MGVRQAECIRALVICGEVSAKILKEIAGLDATLYTKDTGPFTLPTKIARPFTFAISDVLLRVAGGTDVVAEWSGHVRARARDSYKVRVPDDRAC